MSKIYLNRDGDENHHPLDTIITSSIRRALDGEYTIAVTVYGDDVRYCRSDTVIEHDGQYFDTATRRKYRDGEMPMCDIFAEHVSYRLNDEEYNVSTFAMTGTAAELLAQALEGTPFEVGTVEPTGEFTVILNEETSRRALVLAIADAVGGEISYSGYDINIVNHVGSTEYIALFDTDNVIDIGENTDERENIISYDISLGRKTILGCGDNVHIKFDPLEIDERTRITAIEYNPYLDSEVTIEVGDYEPDIVDLYVSVSHRVEEYHQEFTVAAGVFRSAITSLSRDVSTLEQTATSYEMMIQRLGDDDDVITAASIVAAINNDSESTIKLSADRINLSGYVTMTALSGSGTTTINGDNITTGALTIKSGNNTIFSANATSRTVQIAGFSADKNSLYSGTTFANSPVFVCSTGSSSTITIAGRTGREWVFKAGSNFGVTSAGDLYCTSAHLTGEINATSGSIGDATNKWVIGSDSTNASIYNGMTSLSDTAHNGVYIGTDGIALGAGVFKVTSAGKVVANDISLTLGATDGTGPVLSIVPPSESISGQVIWMRRTVSGTTTTLFAVTSGGEVAINSTLSVGSTITPRTDNSSSLGVSSLRFSQVYAARSTINTSDEIEKTDMRDIDNVYMDIFDELEAKQFKYISGDRIHFGFGARAVERLLLKHGLASMDFGALCYDDIEVNGSIARRYGLRYSEFIPLCVSQIQKLKAKINTLEARIAAQGKE